MLSLRFEATCLTMSRRPPLYPHEQTSPPSVRMSPRCPTGDIAPRQELLLLLEHVNRETIGVNLVIHVGPEAIHLIALDIFDGHQWTS